jgi:serine/threonine-protein kinase
MIGTTLGSYRIVEQIGMGGMATVYKAYDPDTDRYVAVKVLSHHYSQEPTFLERFRQEAKAVAGLQHPYILPVHAYGEQDGTAYLVMPYMDTGTLRDVLSRGALPLRETSRLLGQTASALDYAHGKGIIHRDVKPSNLLVDGEGNAYLTDFGIAKIVEATLELTGTGMALGTPQYLSPEQCQGVKDLKPATDVYSLGIVLYQMLTGQVPFQAETPMAVIQKHLTAPLPPPRSLRPDLPEAVEGVVFKALSKEPEQRFPSAASMGEALSSAVRIGEAQAVTELPPVPPPQDDFPSAMVHRSAPSHQSREARTAWLFSDRIHTRAVTLGI